MSIFSLIQRVHGVLENIHPFIHNSFLTGHQAKMQTLEHYKDMNNIDVN